MEITSIKGIGGKTARLFEKLHIATVEELVHYYPRDYEQFGAPVSLRQAQPEEITSVVGEISGNIATRHVRNLSITTFTARCDGGELHLTYFNMPYLKNTVKQGSLYVFRGLLKKKGNRLTMEQARMYQPEEYGRLIDCMQPLYATTKGLSSNAITKAVRKALEIVDLSEDYLPEEIRRNYNFYSLEKAVEQMHFPIHREELVKARERLVFDEFFLFILMLRRMRETSQRTPAGYSMIAVADTGRFIEALPYRLTGAQEKVWREIETDLSSGYVMNRLIQGDVGSGKTILAFLALLMCAANGCQGALMAPTEVLARQHYETLCHLTEQYRLPLTPVLLTGSTTMKAKNIIYKQIENGEANVIIGTHALIQDKVAYHRLALVITDEQHRFGVRQRERLADKGSEVHVLVMSATPIPRTLAIILYGDLKISVLDELPKGRLPVKNCVVNTSYRNKAYQFIEKEVAAGRQVYVICPMVEASESEELEDVGTYTAKLKSVLPSAIRIASLHGKMRPADKNRVMEEFSERLIDVLVSTTVIEVGINVPNATVMMVENAERFGLAQLHQLRGRVGRGKYQSYCIFISKSEKPETMKRLKILKESNDGFYIAGKDLELRGPGDMFGIRQSGDFHFQLGDIFQDASLLQRASDEADRLFAERERLEDEEYAMLRKRLEEFCLLQVSL